MLAGLLTLTLVALSGLVFAGPAAAAGGASVSISPATATLAAGANTTFTLSLSCSVTGGCAGTTITLPVTSYTDLTGASVDDSAQFGNLSCANWTKTATTSTVTYKYTGGSPAGTLPTGSSQCTFVYSTKNYTTPNNQTFTLTPTINGTNFSSSTGNSATVTVTADRKLTFAKRATTATVGNAITKVGQGAQFSYVLHIDCPGDGAIPGAIGTKSITVTDQLPANFTYQSYIEVYNANNGNYGAAPPAPLFPGTVTTPTAGNDNTFTYSDPGGTTCSSTSVSGAPGRDIQIYGTASTAGVPDATGSTIANSATATWTYLDGTPGTVTSSTTVNVVSAVPDQWLSKSPISQSPSNQGQYVYPPSAGTYYQWYTYPGDWNGSGISAQYAINLATNGVASGVGFDLKDPMPCQTNNASPGTAANPNYYSYAPGVLCTKPAFVPTRVVAGGFTPTASDSITVVHTDGTTASVAWDSASQTWPIPASPAVSEIDFPPFASEGSNTSANLQLLVEGYAAADDLTTSLITNNVVGNAYLTGSNSPLTSQLNYATSVMVAPPSSPAGVVVQPGIWPRYNSAGSCTEVVSIGNFGGNGPQSNYIEVARAPSKAIYLSYLAPVGATVTAGTDQTFTFVPHSFSAIPAGPVPGVTATTGTISAVQTSNWNGTGRTLYQWTVPAGTITTPGDYFFQGNDLTVDLGAGCAGVYQNDATVGYGDPITVCPPGNHAPPSKGTNNVLNTTNAPDPNNYCGVSQNITVAPTNPAFSVDKTVKGNLDPVPVGSGGVGNVSPTGGTATYQISFANTGQSNLTNPVMYDLLPRVGDTQASSTTARGSQFPVTLTGVGTVPAGVTVYYSTATNPCRPEVLPTNPGCANDWSTTPPATLGNTTALKFAYTGTVTVTGTSGTHGFTVPFTVSTPNTTPGQIAWNTVGTNALAGASLMGAAESSKTGLQAQVGPTISKSTTATSYSKPGDSIAYTFNVTNNTAVPLTGVGVVDNLTDAAGTSVPPTVSCQSVTSPSATCSGATTNLQPGQVATFTATYVVTQDDLEHGSIADTGTVTATPPTGGVLHNTSNVVTVPALQNAALTLTKSATPTTGARVGDKVTYSFLVGNTGNVTVHGVGINEKSFSGSGTAPVATCPNNTLAPTAQETCTASYVVTQADVDAGSITNTAAARGFAPAGSPVTSADSSAAVTATSDASLSLVKSADPSAAAAYKAGQQITYHYLVTNTGNVTISAVAIKEGTFTGSGPVPGPTCPVSTLAPDAQTDCTATYVLTQADVDAGALSNTATATGTAPGGATVTSAPSTVATPATPDPALTLAKSAAPKTVSSPGDQVDYTFVVTNTGNVTLSGVTVHEGSFTGHGNLVDFVCPPATLVPGQTLTCSAIYSVKQADLDAGSIVNTATASGNPPSGPVVKSSPASATVTAAQTSGLSVVKSADPSAAAAYKTGQQLTYHYLVTNTGNVTVSALAIKEGTFTGSGAVPAPTCPASSLAPGGQLDCTATYVLTQADVDAATLSNTATVTGTAPDGSKVASAPSTVTTPATPAPVLTLGKSASPTVVSAAGDRVTYTLVISNDGNVTVHDVAVDESGFGGSGTLSAVDCPLTTLLPGQAETCTATYVVTQGDVDNGAIANTAHVTGAAPDGSDIRSNDSSASVTVTQTGGLTLVKSADPIDADTAGQVITYHFLVTNSGNLTVSNLVVGEQNFTGQGALSKISCPQTTLPPGAQVDCTATYTIVQGDVDAGGITNTGMAFGTTRAGQVNSAESTVSTPSTPSPSLDLAKSATPTTVTKAGDPVSYSFVVTNNGNVTITNVAIDDSAQFSGTGDLTGLSCPNTSLVPGQSVTCTADYVVTQADVDAGKITNTATASGTAPDASGVTSPPSSATVTATSAPDLTMTKSASPTSVGKAGDSVTYSFLVTNTGNVTVGNVAIDESDFSGTGTLADPTCPDASLAPQAVETCTVTYAVMQADVDAGSITNTATATGTAPGGGPVSSPPSSATVTAAPAPKLTLTKSADPVTVARAGDSVTYSFLVTNTGNVTVGNVAIDDSDFSGTGTLSDITCPDASLAPKGFETCKATYVVTQADIDAGSITNTATASGTPPTGPAVTSAPSSATVTAQAVTGLTLVKSVLPTSVTKSGDTVTYSFAVENSGNVTVTGLSIQETAFSGHATLGTPTCDVTTLAPGDKASCSVDYTVDQVDVDAGKVDNTAVANATARGNKPVASNSSKATVTITPSPALTLVKSADPATVGSVNDVVHYAFAIANTGNVTLTDVAVQEGTFSGTGQRSQVSCPADELAPGDTEKCTADYAVTQADLDAGSVSNSATASATPPSGPALTSDPSTASVTVTQAPGLTLVKTADTTSITHAGQKVAYHFLITNTGNVTLADVTVKEGAFSGTGQLSAIACPTATLAPSAHETCTATYTVTTADLSAATLTNTATATGSYGASTASVTVRSGPSTARVTTSPAATPPPPSEGSHGGDGGGTANTGSDVVQLIGIAAALIITGGLVVAASRRRRRA